MAFVRSLLAATALAAALPALAVQSVTSTITFDEVTSFETVGDSYASLGLSFSAEGLALSNDGTGSGVGGAFYTHAPSMGAVLFAPGVSDTGVAESVTLTAVNGKSFVNSVSFFYSSAYDNVNTDDTLIRAVSVYVHGANGQRLASVSLDQNASLGCSDSPFCNWTKISLSFNGEAQSIVFKGAAGQIAYDNLTVSTVPEPESYALMLAGLAAVGFLARRRA